MEELGNLLFKDIGKVLKRFAVISFIIETIAGIITGIVLMVYYESILFFIFSIAAPFVAYTLCIFLYGFGELVDSTSSTAKSSKENNNVIAEDEIPEL